MTVDEHHMMRALFQHQTFVIKSLGITYLSPRLLTASFSCALAGLSPSLRADNAGRYQPFFLGLWEFSLNQPRIGKALAVHRFDERIEAVKCVDFDVALIQAKGEFVHIAMEMLRAGVMIDTVHSALHYRPNALDTVRPSIAPAVLARAVVDRFMVEEDG